MAPPLPDASQPSNNDANRWAKSSRPYQAPGEEPEVEQTDLQFHKPALTVGSGHLHGEVYVIEFLHGLIDLPLQR